MGSFMTIKAVENVYPSIRHAGLNSCDDSDTSMHLVKKNYSTTWLLWNLDLILCVVQLCHILSTLQK